jgi:hypothetical protein
MRTSIASIVLALAALTSPVAAAEMPRQLLGTWCSSTYDKRTEIWMFTRGQCPPAKRDDPDAWQITIAPRMFANDFLSLHCPLVDINSNRTRDYWNAEFACPEEKTLGLGGRKTYGLSIQRGRLELFDYRGKSLKELEWGGH